MAPPLGRQDSIISIDSMPNCGMPPHPPFVSYAEALSTQRVGEVVCFWPAPNFGQIMGLNLSEDLFFFALHLILGKKSDLFWVEQVLILIFVLLKFFKVPAPSFQNPAYATD